MTSSVRLELARHANRAREGAESDPHRRPRLEDDESDVVARFTAAGLYLEPHDTRTRRHRAKLRAQHKRAVAIVVKPTLRQAWPREDPGPQCAFKMSMFNESCNSH